MKKPYWLNKRTVIGIVLLCLPLYIIILCNTISLGYDLNSIDTYLISLIDLVLFVVFIGVGCIGFFLLLDGLCD